MIVNDSTKVPKGSKKIKLLFFCGKNGDFYTSLKWLVNASNKVANVSKI